MSGRVVINGVFVVELVESVMVCELLISVGGLEQQQRGLLKTSPRLALNNNRSDKTIYT